MIRVGILTYHFSDNYGALLQAYSLRKWFLKRDIKAEFINYHPSYVEEGGDFDQPFNLRKWRKNLTILYLRFSHLRRRLFGNQHQKQAFELFRKNVLSVSGPRLKTIDDLDGFTEYDLLVCGSDQIWNPSSQRGLDPVYFLAFSRASRSRRISYAASFGKPRLDSQYDEQAKELLSSLNAISVREKSGVEIVKSLATRDGVCVPDPTILLGDFSDFLQGNSNIPAGHVFCYALRTADMIREVATLVGKDLNTKILSPYNAHRRWSEIGETVYPSPDEWVCFLNNAAVVVTNSFHGVALSIILQKPFVAIALPGKKKGLNERVWNLLDQLGLRDRMLESDNYKDVRHVMKEDIDWATVAMRLEAMRADGNAFLEGELERVGH
jgi:polysaccharide pyruvyl transferase WcaK-like protein